MGVIPNCISNKENKERKLHIAIALTPLCPQRIPRPRWGAYSAPPDPLAGFGGRFAAGEGLGWGRGGKEGGEGEEGGSGEEAPSYS